MEVQKVKQGRWLYRSAVDGRFYTREEAQKRPDNYVKEWVEDKPKKVRKEVKNV